MTSPSGVSTSPLKEQEARTYSCTGEEILAKIAEILGAHYPSYLRLLKRWFYRRERKPVTMSAQLEKASKTVAKLPQEISRDIVFHILMWTNGISAFGRNAREYLIDAIEMELKTLMEELVKIRRFRASIVGGNDTSSSADSSKVIMWSHLNDLVDAIDTQHFSPRPRMAY
ncbi:hypothetical protein TTRE_0000530701 [Trichuris trichiura]|uniref:Uncharacterized protein n=1 Tax=Trichuris trichiura TaxID=36087 RepID=A0A077ZB05_TRITR|nr:hypothetical protein TTRE_0000530701 [Trichuris trichiura]